MRITESMMSRDILSQIQQAETTVSKYAQQVSSGKRLNVPSDDPTGTSVDVATYAQLGVLGRYSSAADTASAALSVVDSAMNDMTHQLLSAKTAVLSVQGSGVSAAQRQAAVATLQGVREALVSDFGTNFQGMYLFGGTETQTAPFTIANGVVSSYQGNSTAASVDVGSHTTVAVTVDGSAIAQGGGSTDLFQQIDAMITAIQTNDSAGMQAGAAALDAASQRIGIVQAGVGTSLNRLESASARLTTMKTAAQSQIAAIEDVDLSQAITGLQQGQAAEQAAFSALGTTGRLRTLMDYIA